MPMIEELLAKIQEAPPQTEEDLRGMLAETGYDLVVVEPSMEEGPPMEDMMEGEVEGEAEEGAPAAGRSLDEILGMMEGPGDEGPTDTVVEEDTAVAEEKGGPINIRALTMDVSKRKIAESKKGKKDKAASA